MASNVNNLGVAYEVGQNARTKQYEEYAEQYKHELERAKTELADMEANPDDYTENDKAAIRFNVEQKQLRYDSVIKVLNEEIQQKATSAAYQMADDIQAQSAEDIEKAKEYSGAVGGVLVDAGASMTQSALDGLGNFLLGAPQSMVPFAVRAFGGGTQQARNANPNSTLAQQIAFGATSAAKEVFTEKMFNIASPFKKLYGGGSMDDVVEGAIERVVEKLGKTDLGKAILGGGLTFAAGALSEGAEELIGDWFEWQLPRIYDGDVATAKETLANSLYDFLVGATSGAMGGLVDVNTFNYQAKTGDSANVTNSPVTSKNDTSIISDNTALAEGDLDEYLRTGKREHVRNEKTRILQSGESPILTTVSQVKEYIRNAVLGKITTGIRAYGKVGKRMASDVSAIDGDVNIGGYYLELDANRLKHLSDHVGEDKDSRNIPLTIEQAENLAEYINDYDDLLSVEKKHGGIRFLLGKKINGHAVIVEMISKGRNSVMPVTAWQNTTEYYLKKYKKEPSLYTAQNQEVPSGRRAVTPSVDATIQETDGGVNNNISNIDAVLDPVEAPSNEPLKLFLPSGDSLVDSARRCGVSDATLARVQRISRAIGREIEFYQSDVKEENGYYSKETGVIYLNAKSQNPVAQIISHELTHSLEGTISYAELKRFVWGYLEANSIDLDALRQKKMDDYAKANHPLRNESEADFEIVANYVEKCLLTDEQSIRDIVSWNRSLGQRIMDWLNGLIAKLGNKDAQQRAALIKARNAYAKALQESMTQNQTAQNTIQGDNQNVQQTNVDTADEYLLGLRERLGNGDISEEEFDALFDAYYNGGDEGKYSFGGASSQTADLDALERAQEMEKKGVAADGKILYVSGKENAEPTPGGGVTVSSSLAAPINSASGLNVSNNSQEAKKQFSISAEQNRAHLDAVSQGDMDAAQKDEIFRNIKNILDGGGKKLELKRYIDTLSDGYGGWSDDKSAGNTSTFSAAEQIFKRAHDRNMSVDEFLRQNWELYERDGSLNEDAQKALELERNRSKRKYSISPELESDLEEVLNNTYASNRGEVYLGETSNFLIDELGADALPVTMPAKKAYSAIVTEARAREDGRYDPNTNYHGLGLNGLMEVLEASENPMVAFADTSSNGDLRENHIVLVTDKYTGNAPIVVVEAMNVRSRLDGKKLEANKVITSYGREQIAHDIIDAAHEGRLLYVDKKRSQSLLAGRPGANYLAAMREADFENNIQNFWGRVKWEKQKRQRQVIVGF